MLNAVTPEKLVPRIDRISKRWGRLMRKSAGRQRIEQMFRRYDHIFELAMLLDLQFEEM